MERTGVKRFEGRQRAVPRALWLSPLHPVLEYGLEYRPYGIGTALGLPIPSLDFAYGSPNWIIGV